VAVPDDVAPVRGLQPATVASLSTLAYDALRGAILRGTFAPGQRLPEGAVSSALGMSRQPVREALIRLRHEGLVVERPRRGTYVAEMSSEDFVDLYNLRVPLEVTAAVLLVRRSASLAGVDAVLAEMREAESAGPVHDVAATSDLEYRFHRQVFAASGNPRLVQVFASISGPMQLALALDNALYEGAGSTVAEHEPLVAALHSGDEAAAARAMFDHVTLSFAEVVARLDGDASRVAWRSSDDAAGLALAGFAASRDGAR
jgi:DNA-binding GntR family transcriptional regulator